MDHQDFADFHVLTGLPQNAQHQFGQLDKRRLLRRMTDQSRA
jgi:hypothetical protein